MKPRQGGLVVVVRGADTDANRRLAETIEAAVGSTPVRQTPPKRAGPRALPHCQQSDQLLLSDLGKFLRASESAKVAGELEYISTKLAPFRDYKLKAFADFLEKAEALARGAAAPPRGKGNARTGKADPATVEQACQRVLEVYGKAIDPSVTVEQIEATVQALQALDPARARLDQLAQQMGYSQKFKAKADVLKAIRQKIIGRKGAFERPNA